MCMSLKKVMLPVYKIREAMMRLGLKFLDRTFLDSYYHLFCFSSKDILSRWTFPLVPDNNHPGGHIYEHRRGNRYIAKDNSVILARYELTKII